MSDTILSNTPLSADSNVQNSIDFHIAATNFLDILNKYINEVALSYVYNFLQYTHDPITKGSEFFAKFNNNELDLTSNEGGINQHVKGTLTVKIDSKLNTNEIWKTDENGTIESRINDGIVEYQAIDTQTSTTRWVPIEQDVIDEVTEKTDLLEEAFGEEKLSNEFILYWIEKFKTSHAKIKESYSILITNKSDDIFTDFSDSTGNLSRTTIDATVIPIYNLDFTPPEPFNVLLGDKIDASLKTTIKDLSKFTLGLFRTNLTKLIDSNVTSADIHGENLVTDELDYNRILDNADDLNQNVSDALGKIYKIILYVRTLLENNQQQITDINYSAVIEDSLVNIDLLKNKVQTLSTQKTTLLSLSAQ